MFLETLLNAIKTAIEQDTTLNPDTGYLNYLLCAQGGSFPMGTPKPVIVISPDGESLEYAAMTKERIDRTALITLYAYTEAFGEEIGLFGQDDLPGVVTLGDELERLLMHNLLNGLVREAKVVRKTYPLPPQQWNPGLNEVRVQVQYKARTVWPS